MIAAPIVAAFLAVGTPPSEALVLEPLTSPCGPKSELPHLVALPGGGVAMSWVEREGPTAGTMKVATRAGEDWGAPRTVLQADDLFLNWADFPSVQVLEGGAMMAHWLRKTGEGYAYGVEFTVAASALAPWSAPRWLHEDRSPTEHGFVSIAPVDRDTFGALWLDGRQMAGAEHGEHGAGEMAIYFRTVEATGELGEEVLLDARVCDCCQTSLAQVGGGDLVATYRDRSAEEIRDVSSVRREGGAWSRPTSVHDDGWLMPGCPVNGPRTVVRGGLEATAWYTGVGEGGGSVLLAFRGAGDETWSTPIDVDDGLPVGRVDLLFADDASVLVAWLEAGASASTATWRVRRVQRDGELGDALDLAEVPNERSSGFLRMAREGDDALLAWTAATPERGVRLARVSWR